LIDINKESLNKLLNLTHIKHLKKNKFLVKAGEKQTNCYILKSGIMRSYYSDESGNIYIILFS
jgi:CRP-like cAMP-binding protein